MSVRALKWVTLAGVVSMGAAGCGRSGVFFPVGEGGTSGAASGGESNGGVGGGTSGGANSRTLSCQAFGTGQTNS